MAVTKSHVKASEHDSEKEGYEKSSKAKEEQPAEDIKSEGKDWHRDARNAMKFFVDKMVKIGNKFVLVTSSDLLIKEKTLGILANSTDFNIAMGTANHAVDRLLKDNITIVGHKIQISNYKESVLLNCWLMHEMRKYSIPKNLKGGLHLLYLWLCLGIAFIDEDFANGAKEIKEVKEEIFDEEEASSDQEV